MSRNSTILISVLSRTFFQEHMFYVSVMHLQFHGVGNIATFTTDVHKHNTYCTFQSLNSEFYWGFTRSKNLFSKILKTVEMRMLLQLFEYDVTVMERSRIKVLFHTYHVHDLGTHQYRS
jgi:hypothetical protein